MVVLPAAHFVAWITASALLGIVLTLACLRRSTHRVEKEWERMATDRVLP